MGLKELLSLSSLLENLDSKDTEAKYLIRDNYNFCILGVNPQSNYIEGIGYTYLYVKRTGKLPTCISSFTMNVIYKTLPPLFFLHYYFLALIKLELKNE